MDSRSAVHRMRRSTKNRESGVSHDQGNLLPPHTARPIPSERPSLDRPSLFAGMDTGASGAGDELQSVRILSTLESSRRSSRRGGSASRSRRRNKGQSWQSKVLLALMLVGIVSVLVSFAMVIQDGHPDAPSVAPTHRAAAAASTAHPAPSVPHQQADQVATIEIMEAVGPAASIPSTPANTTHETAATSPAARTEVIAAVGSTSNKPPSAIKPAKRKHADDDVALLEAMFAHSNHRKPGGHTPSEDAWQRCASLEGAAASACRARYCVQHAGASVCSEHH